MFGLGSLRDLGCCGCICGLVACCLVVLVILRYLLGLIAVGFCCCFYLWVLGALPSGLLDGVLICLLCGLYWLCAGWMHCVFRVVGLSCCWGLLVVFCSLVVVVLVFMVCVDWMFGCAWYGVGWLLIVFDCVWLVYCFRVSWLVW